MASVEHCIGEYEHIYPKHKLRLKTRCSIKLSSSHGLIFPFSSLFRELRTLVSSGIWVSRGNGLRILFQIITDDFPHDFDRATFIKGLGAILRGAEIWNQLDLKACLVPDRGCEGVSFPSENLCFTLTHGDVISAAQGIKQPPGVPCAFLEHIQITFDFSYLSLYFNEKNCKLTAGEELELRIKLANYCSSYQINIPQHLFLETPLLFSHHDQQPAVQKFAAEMPLVGRFWKRAAPDEFQNGEKVIFGGLIKLIDAGLRTMICGDMIRPLPGITLSARHSGSNLAEVSPALFRPGYLQAVCDYDGFFETIAHTMFMIYTHSNSVSLRSKIDTLKNFAPEECLEDEMMDFQIPCTSEQVLKNAMKVRLWRLVVSKLRRRPESATLNPLDWADECFDRTLDAREILEEETDGDGSEGMLNDDDWFEFNSLDIEDDTLDEGLFESEDLAMLDSEDEALVEEEDYASKGTTARDGNELSYSPTEVILDDNEELAPDDFCLGYAQNCPSYSMYQAGGDDDEMLMDESVS